MGKYRKKPVVIEAWQSIDGCGNHTAGIPHWILDAIASGIIFRKDNSTFIDTFDGDMKVSDGDWIIRGVKGELSPCKPDIFAATYEPVAACEEAEGGR